MSRRRRRHRRHNPAPNPVSTDLLIGLGLVAVVGGVGYYLYTQSQAATTPVASTMVNGQTVALNAKGQVISTSSLTPAQQGALAAQNAAAQNAGAIAARAGG